MAKENPPTTARRLEPSALTRQGGRQPNPERAEPRRAPRAIVLVSEAGLETGAA